MPPNTFETFCEENLADLNALCERFADYEPTQGFAIAHLQAWLRQFSAQHRTLALKLAESVAYYGTNQISALMRPLKAAIDVQVAAQQVNPQSVLYVPLGRAGESGSDIIRRFRNVNRLHGLQQQFATIIELPDRIFTIAQPVIFFLDDFVGTGKQVSDAWTETISQVVPEYIPMYLAVVAGFQDGITRVEAETPFRVISVHTLGTRHQLMESACRNFSSQEKNTLKRYCETAGNQPLGFGDHALLVSFAYGTPNNSISAIRGSEKQTPWRGLLPAWEDL